MTGFRCHDDIESRSAVSNDSFRAFASDREPSDAGGQGLSGEYADAARPDEKANDDEDDSPEHLPPEQRDDAGDHQDGGEYQ